MSSCGCVQEWWRTELQLRRGESFHDSHGATALGTAPQGLGGWCGRGFRLGLRWNCIESSEAPRQQSGAPSIGEEAEVADADEALGEQVKQEATQKLIVRDGHHFLPIVVGRVAPAEGDLAVGEGDQAMVGDGDAVSIAAEILQHILGSTERWFRVDDPIFAEERT